MNCKIVPLANEHLDSLRKAGNKMCANGDYLTDGSVGYCLLADGEPVFVGGVVNMQWRRGEAWMLPTIFFREHRDICLRYIYRIIKLAAVTGGFRRIQATCAINISTTLFDWLGFKYEGTLAAFGPNSETCHLYAKVFSK